jgi:16S rRNA (uracil1498-N3)-methyltransferase
MKQSLKAKKTVLNEPCSFKDFVSNDLNGIRMIAHCDSSTERKKISEVCSKNTNSIILIGPEGDFSREEVTSAITMGYIPVHLGPSRLRTETAGVAVCYSIYFINQ